MATVAWKNVKLSPERPKVRVTTIEELQSEAIASSKSELVEIKVKHNYFSFGFFFATALFLSVCRGLGELQCSFFPSVLCEGRKIVQFCDSTRWKIAAHLTLEPSFGWKKCRYEDHRRRENFHYRFFAGLLPLQPRISDCPSSLFIHCRLLLLYYFNFISSSSLSLPYVKCIYFDRRADTFGYHCMRPTHQDGEKKKKRVWICWAHSALYSRDLTCNVPQTGSICTTTCSLPCRLSDVTWIYAQLALVKSKLRWSSHFSFFCQHSFNCWQVCVLWLKFAADQYKRFKF